VWWVYFITTTCDFTVEKLYDLIPLWERSVVGVLYSNHLWFHCGKDVRSDTTVRKKCDHYKVPPSISNHQQASSNIITVGRFPNTQMLCRWRQNRIRATLYKTTTNKKINVTRLYFMIHHTHLRAHTHTHTHTRIRTRTRCRQGRHHMGPGLPRRGCAFIGASVHTKHTHHTHAHTHTRTHTLQAGKAPHEPWTTTQRMCLYWC